MLVNVTRVTELYVYPCMFLRKGRPPRIRSSTSMVPGTGTMLTSDWSLVEAGSPVPRDRGRVIPRSPRRPKRMPAQPQETTWHGSRVLPAGKKMPLLPLPSHSVRVPAELRKASWRWRAGRN